MLERDYLMRLIVMLAAALRAAAQREGGVTPDPTAKRIALEDAIGQAADMDPSVLLSLEPESVSTVLLLGQIDDSVAEYICHALMMDADFLEEEGYAEAADLRRRQAANVAASFDFIYDPGRLPALIEAADLEG